MVRLQQYALAVVTGAVICSVVLSVAGNSSHVRQIRLLCGIYLGILILKPIAGNNWNIDRILPEIDGSEAAVHSAWGAEMAEEAMAKRISAQLEAYILDKATRAEADLSVTVILSEDQLPVGVELRGRVTDKIQEELSAFLESELGIPKENQRWTG